MESINPNQILYPSFALFLLVCFVLFRMGGSRFFAIRRKEMSIKYYRIYREGEEPEHMRVLSRHLINLFEVPVLFYVITLFIYVTQHVDPLMVGLAWGYTGLRYLHSFIHLTSNNVSRRFFVYILSVLVLMVMWGGLFLRLVTAN